MDSASKCQGRVMIPFARFRAGLLDTLSIHRDLNPESTTFYHVLTY